MLPSLAKEMLLGRDWVGAPELIKLKEGMLSECTNFPWEGFLDAAWREQMRLLQQDDYILTSRSRGKKKELLN